MEFFIVIIKYLNSRYRFIMYFKSGIELED